MKKHNNTLSAIIILSLVALTAVVWWNIISFSNTNRFARAHFFYVGEGDSELVIFPGNIKVMTDAGPDASVLASIEKVMPSGDDYIDLAIISHPQLDHFNGYHYLLDHYRIGAFIWNGRDNISTEWSSLLQKIKLKHIPIVTMGAGDSIHYENNEINILSPDAGFATSAELNDTVLVELVKTAGFKAILTGDIGFNVEDHLVAQGKNLRADILKIAHHGSKFSSGKAFLRAVNPKIAVIEVGAKNKYGHPTKETLARIASSTGAVVLRTDQSEAIAIIVDNGKLRVVTNQP